MTQIMKSSNQDFLLISLSQDLKCLNEIFERIVSVENYNMKSWLFPQKSIKQCRDQYTLYETNDVTYVRCLELIIEKLYIMLNFLNQRKANDKRKRNIHYPSRITLGRCVQIFWDSTQTEDEDIPSKNTNSLTNLIINKGCQTDNKSLNKCDSCSEVNEFMKNMIKFMSENFEDSSTKNMLTTMNENIFSTTKFGSILKFVDSMKQDYEKLVKKLNNKCAENTDLMDDLRRSKINNEEMEQNIKELNVLKHKLNENLTNAKKEIILLNGHLTSMKEEKDLLQQDCNTFGPILDDVTNQIKKLKEERIESRKEFEIQVNSYEDKIRGYNAKIVDYQVTNNNLHKDLDKLRCTYGELFGKYSKMCKLNKKLEQSLEDINDSMSDLNNITERTMKSVKNYSEKTTELNEKVKLLNINFEEEKINTDAIQKKIIGIRQQRSKNGKTEVSSIQGNPLLDFKKQIEENEERIKKLQEENGKYASILRAYRRTCNTRNRFIQLD